MSDYIGDNIFEAQQALKKYEQYSDTIIARLEQLSNTTKDSRVRIELDNLISDIEDIFS